MESILQTNSSDNLETTTFLEATKRSKFIWDDMSKNPNKYRVLTGERPTGPLHIGHLFGTVSNRVFIQNLGVTMFIVIADYQVLTDRHASEHIRDNVYEIMLDYLAAGLDPESKKTHFFVHSQIPELNQLMLPFMSLVTMAELSRNPTVKDEIKSSCLSNVNSLMYTYPIHQAADILFCKGNVVPVGKDQLPHLELTRKIARRFNEAFKLNIPIFPVPNALLSDMPAVLGTDGKKMSKSRNNTIMLKMTPDATANAIKKAKTDSERRITYDPENRPEVSNLLQLINICTGEDVRIIADRIGSGGSGKLKVELTEVINEYLLPLRQKRKHLENDKSYIKSILNDGICQAREEGRRTLEEVKKAMHMDYNIKY